MTTLTTHEQEVNMKAIAIIATVGALIMTAIAAGEWMGNLSNKHHNRIELVAAGGRG